MDPMGLAGMAFTLLLAMLIGGFILLFPLSRRLGLLLEAKLNEKRGPAAVPPVEMRQLWDAVHMLESEVQQLGQRQEFIEKLLAQGEQPTRAELPEP